MHNVKKLVVEMEEVMLVLPHVVAPDHVHNISVMEYINKKNF